MIYTFSDYSGPIDERCDVCVIGSGAGGAVAAMELAESGLSVIVLEEGGLFTPKSWTGKPTQALIDMYRDGGSTGALGNPFISTTLGKCVGGTTTVNSATCFRTPEVVLQRWQMELGLRDLTMERLAPVFERVERIINVTELSWDVLGNSAKIIKRGADRLGLACRPLKHNVKDCRGCGTCQFGCVENAKQSMDVTYIPRAIACGARLFANCRADRLVIEKGAVRGVVGSIVDPHSGERAFDVTIAARAVVAACGALITPALLKRSGLRNRNIGRHLQIHPASRVVALMNETVEGWKGVSQGVYVHNYETEGIILEGIFIHPSLMLAALPGVGPEHKELAARYANLAAFGVMVHDSTVGRVRRGISCNGFLATYFITRADAEKLKRGIAYAARVFFAAGAERVYAPVATMPVLSSADDVEKLLGLPVRPNQIETMAFHPLGTCRMAESPRLGAINEKGESFEVRDLYVADAGAVPTSLGVNPQVTIMALATIVAQGIARRFSGRPSF